nr:MAG TPA: hypothetical protein [Caudoviricetes sp.]
MKYAVILFSSLSYVGLCLPACFLCYVHSLQHYDHSVNSSRLEIFNKYAHSYLCNMPMYIDD